MASTYVNNLRLNEMATGDASGTWGTTTNTNLELVGQALGYGTESITTNANTHTSTVADGAADEARAMYIKYTGTLDSACTITIGPNTLKRVHIIENATSGSQNIIIKQGSGATVTIGNGNVSAVYLDGAGSGAAVVNAFTDLETAGTITVAGNLIASADATVGDDLSLVSDAAVLGFGADTDVTLTHVADTGLLLNSSRQLQFGDSGTYIHQSADGTLDLVADTEIEINATTIDMNGALNLSGNALVSGEVQTANIGYTDGDNAITIADGGGITAANGITSTAASNTFGATSFNDADITNVGSIALDTIINDGTNITLDSGAQIILDGADDGTIQLHDAGTKYADIYSTSGDFYIKSTQSDKDIKFQGNDGGTGFTALTLDMSDAGAATFNGKITANAGIDIDNFNIDGTTLALSSGDMTLDVAGNIQLDADDNGEVRFLDGGTQFATVKKDGNNALFQSIVADGDFVIQGIDGSSFISALTFDMSNAGAATFNSAVTATAVTVNGQLNVTNSNSNTISCPQVATQFDTSSFMRFHPSATTDSNGYTNIIFGTSTSNNFGVAIGGLREGDDGTPTFTVRMLNDSIAGTLALKLTNAGDLTIPGSSQGSCTLDVGRTGTSGQGAAILNLKSQNASELNFFDVGTNTMRLFSHSVNTRWKDVPNSDDSIQFEAAGNIDIDGAYLTGGFDYAEYFESTDGTAIPVGTSVVLVNEKVRAATSGEQPLGVVRPGSDGTSVVGGSAGLRWAGKYLKDDYDAYLYDTVDYWTWKDVGDTNNTGDEDQQCWSDRVPEGWVVPSDKTVTSMQRKRLNPDFVENLDSDGEQIYVNRESRDEWNCIGLLGQVPITKGQVTNSNWTKLKDRSASVELWFIK